MLTVRTSENTVITSFRLISERQDFSSVRTGENTVRARARIHKTLKTRSSCVRNCVSDNESLIGKTFVLFLVASIEMIVRARLRKYFEGGKTSDSLPTDYDRSCRVIDSLNNVIQTKFCDGYYFGGSAEKKCGLFEALGVSVPGSEPEEERDYEDEEETES